MSRAVEAEQVKQAIVCEDAAVQRVLRIIAGSLACGMGWTRHEEEWFAKATSWARGTVNEETLAAEFARCPRLAGLSLTITDQPENGKRLAEIRFLHDPAGNEKLRKFASAMLTRYMVRTEQLWSMLHKCLHTVQAFFEGCGCMEDDYIFARLEGIIATCNCAFRVACSQPLIANDRLDQDQMAYHCETSEGPWEIKAEADEFLGFLKRYIRRCNYSLAGFTVIKREMKSRNRHVIYRAAIQAQEEMARNISMWSKVNVNRRVWVCYDTYDPTLRDTEAGESDTEHPVDKHQGYAVNMNCDQPH